MCFLPDMAVPEEEEEEEVSPFKKIGTKKLRKIKEKAEKKVMREVNLCVTLLFMS